MKPAFSLRDSSKISRIATLIVFLALIRSISEPFRLQYYSETSLGFDEIKPFLMGSLIASVGLLSMTILSYFGRHKMIIATCILTIVILLILKKVYLTP
jgi:hypothetical protein